MTSALAKRLDRQKLWQDFRESYKTSKVMDSPLNENFSPTHLSDGSFLSGCICIYAYIYMFSHSNFSSVTIKKWPTFCCTCCLNYKTLHTVCHTLWFWKSMVLTTTSGSQVVCCKGPTPCQCLQLTSEVILFHSLIREPFKNYLADFVR